ncbi:MAG: 1-deoxy-D-xylulose-5-phosphate synthase [Treponema sp.]|jgi:1-deoxy-D-xylulose-5-phosphate synthase|nr:1-deoxy-D-xylulose-5-phosphate synthase [Treponema sp.]
MQPQFLPHIESPRDIKNLKIRELESLAREIRSLIISTVSHNGGHLSSNLGVVELAIALHRVFNSPQDAIVWDVGHQSYAHKLLTGRYPQFSSLRKPGGISGFPKRGESVHDVFNTGHASTSISAALGLLAADRAMGKNTRAVAVIGDGALTGGLAFEALSHAGHLGLPLIVILNDNKMSISRNVGGLSKYLSRLSMKTRYQVFRRNFDSMTRKIPYFGDIFFDLVVRLKRAVKAVFYTDNFFVDLGFEYVGPIRGHNIETLIRVLEDVKLINRPVVIHVLTHKGKGYGYAEDDPGNYHGVGSFSVDGGISNKDIKQNKKTFTEVFSESLTAAAAKDYKIAALTAAMQKGAGLDLFARSFPGRFYDVGIAEEHAVTFAAGLASRGYKPIVAVYSTFIQRAVDQIIHDAALQKLPVVLALDRAGFVSDDGETHQGLFDIALLRCVPSMTLLAPSGESEMRLMMDYVLNGKIHGPAAIRYPKAYCPDSRINIPLETGRGCWISKGEKKQLCLAFTGSLYNEAVKAASLLKEKDIECDLYNLRFLKPVDEDYLVSIMNEYGYTVFAEEGIREGCFGEYAASIAMRNNCGAKITVLAVEGELLQKNGAMGTREELLAAYGIDSRGIAREAELLIKRK